MDSSGASRSEPDAGTVEVGGSAPTDQPARTRDSVPVGERLGRYLILDKLGEGGMGVVYRALDPTLDREVALKRVRVAGESEANEARLLREAQAMAKLSHPNVVPVFAAEIIDDEIAIAMELVDGETLHRRLQRTASDWREIVRLFIGAGRGLEAAHRADLVHRDFKPSNVLVDTEGRVRVMDFGLARSGDPHLDSRDTSLGSLSGSSLSSLTAAGAVMGTPRYMAPEQHTGQPVDPRADQYAFCVALWGALYGRPPFVADTYERLVAAKLRGEFTPPEVERARPVPRRLRVVLERGLAAQPDDRHPSMGTLIADLEALVTPASRPWLGLAIGLGLGGATLASVLLVDAGGAACLTDTPPVEAVWSSEARDELHRHLRSTDPAAEATTPALVAARLDRFAADWGEGYRDACRATHERGEQSAEGLDLRMACLDRQVDALKATLAVLHETDASSIDKAVQIAAGLPDPAACGDVERLRTDLAPPADAATRQAVAALRADLERVAALRLAGRNRDAHAEAQTALDAAEATGYRPAIVEAMARVGSTAERLDDYERASRILTDAYYEARAIGHGAEIVRIAVDLIYLDGYRRQRAEAAERWSREALAEIQRRGDDEQLRARVASHMAMVAMLAGDLDGMTEQLTYVLEVESRADPPDPLELASAHDKLGTAYYASERPEEALEHLELAIEMYGQELGPDHPKLLPCWTNRGAALMSLQRLEESLESLRRAEAIAMRIHDEQSADVGLIHNHIGNTLSLLGRHDEADREFAAAVAALSATLGEEHQHTISVTSNWGAALSRRGDHMGALAKYTTAFEATRRLVPADHPAMADYHSNLGMSLDELGRHEEALVHHEAALPIFAKVYGAESDAYALGLAQVGGTLVALGRNREAVEPLEAFMAIDLPDHVPPNDTAPPRFELARALWETGGDRTRARQLAIEAQGLLRDAGMSHESIDAWLAAHPAP